MEIENDNLNCSVYVAASAIEEGEGECETPRGGRRLPFEIRHVERDVCKMNGRHSYSFSITDWPTMDGYYNLAAEGDIQAESFDEAVAIARTVADLCTIRAYKVWQPRKRAARKKGAT